MKRFALVDCNNFFVSCERIFNPKLIGKPVVVLSSNDACVIARSNEAKQLGIVMGQPAFECKDIFRRYKVLVYSSNFTLYGDISRRVMQVISDYSLELEIYSIDEAFLFFPESASATDNYYYDYAQLIKSQIRQQVGIPVSIGLGPTKTLAKIANRVAKKNSQYNGVFDITNHTTRDDILKNTDVADVWGIGYRYTKWLRARGIVNAYQLSQCDDEWVRKNLTINGLKTVLELRAIACFQLQEGAEAKKSITVSRSFGRNVTDMHELKQAVAYHIMQAARKMRKQNMAARLITVFVCYTGYQDSRRLYNSMSMQLPIAQLYTPHLITGAHQIIEKLFKKGQIYKKVGVVLDDLYDNQAIQMHVLSPIPQLEKQAHLMNTIDSINEKMGKNTIFFAAAGTNQVWHAKQDQKSPAYTTNWNELLTIRIN